MAVEEVQERLQDWWRKDHSVLGAAIPFLACPIVLFSDLIYVYCYKNATGSFVVDSTHAYDFLFLHYAAIGIIPTAFIFSLVVLRFKPSVRFMLGFISLAGLALGSHFSGLLLRVFAK